MDLVGNNTMDKEQFLIMFVKQLENQDPLNPMDSNQFTSELAQFSQLEQMFNMNESLATIADSQQDINSGANSNLIGRHVTWETEFGLMEDTVTSISVEDGTTLLNTSNGDIVSLGDITEISAQK